MYFIEYYHTETNHTTVMNHMLLSVCYQLTFFVIICTLSPFHATTEPVSFHGYSKYVFAVLVTRRQLYYVLCGRDGHYRPVETALIKKQK